MNKLDANKLPEFLYGLPLYSALTAGLLGVFFGRLIFLQTNISSLSLDAISDAGEKSTITLRGLVGVCGALIVYFFLQSGLIKGSVFPAFEQLRIRTIEWPHIEGKSTLEGGKSTPEGGKVTPQVGPGIPWLIILPSEPLSLLVVWYFLAGFSERLVPNILASTEKTLSDAAQKGKG